jgi:hypothetical protein
MNKLIDFIKKDIPYHFLLEGASEAMLEVCEKTLGLKLPDSYAAFLQFSNGALLYESDELFGTQQTVEGVGSLTETRTYKIAEFLPEGFLLFHDNGFESHTFDTRTRSETGEYRVVQWDADKRTVEQAYGDLAEWVEGYLARKWE